ncbi:glycosyl transferase family 2 [Thermus thermophilus]|nr:glycosyl transferase family 2 [Thermus thermophilus]
MKLLFLTYQLFVLVYFALLNLLYALFALFGVRMVARYARELSELALKDLLEREAYLPVSILVPTYNEEKTIAASVRSFLALHYPEFEVVVVADGPKDRTLEVLKEAFRLVPVEAVFRRALPTKPIRGVYRSLTHPNLLVVDKENGGKADALNAGLNLARYPLFCAVDADSLLDAQALLRASRLFLEDDRVLAVGGTIRPLNGARVREGVVEALGLPGAFWRRCRSLSTPGLFSWGAPGGAPWTPSSSSPGPSGSSAGRRSLGWAGTARTPWGRTWSWWCASTAGPGRRGGSTASSTPRTPSATPRCPRTGPP